MSWLREKSFKDLLNCIQKENVNDLDGFAAVCFPPESAGGYCTFHLVYKAYKGDLNAARSLHETVLPKEHQWFVGSMRDGKRSVTFAGGTDINEPARAWLIDIIKELIKREEHR